MLVQSAELKIAVTSPGTACRAGEITSAAATSSTKTYRLGVFVELPLGNAGLDSCFFFILFFPDKLFLGPRPLFLYDLKQSSLVYAYFSPLPPLLLSPSAPGHPRPASSGATSNKVYSACIFC